MAIAFNLPSDEATEENYARLNRLLAELYEVLCHILVSRQPIPSSSSADSGIDQETGYRHPQPHPRVRPASDSDTISDQGTRRSTLGPLPDLLGDVPATPPRPRPRSATNPGFLVEPIFDYNDDGDDDVFLTVRADEAVFVTPAPRSDCLYPRPRSRPDDFITPRPRVRRRPGLIGKTWLEKSRLTGDETDGRLPQQRDDDDGVKSHDITDSPSSSAATKMEDEPEGSLLSLLMPDRFSGSLWTAVLVVVGWKLLANKR